jgi:outer membrane protein
MKNFLVVSNIVLIALVGYLYYVNFSSEKSSTPTTTTSKTAVTKTAGTSLVGYLDLDSLQNNYEYYKLIKQESERKQQANDAEMSGLQKRYQNRAMQLQQRGPSMNQQEQDAAMKEIGQMQQDLQFKKQKLDNDLFEYNTKKKDDILKRIQNFLKEYNKDGKYSYIFSYEPGFMFYKDSTLNVTADVIEGLNKAYKSEKKK